MYHKVATSTGPPTTMSKGLQSHGAYERVFQRQLLLLYVRNEYLPIFHRETHSAISPLLICAHSKSMSLDGCGHWSISINSQVLELILHHICQNTGFKARMAPYTTLILEEFGIAPTSPA